MSPSSTNSPPRRTIGPAPAPASARTARDVRPTAEPSRSTFEEDGLRRIARVLMLLAVFTFGIRTTLISSLTAGTALSLALSPLWLQTLRRYWGARILMSLGVVALAIGIWLAWTAPDARTFDSYAVVEDITLLLGLMAGVGVLLWCRQVFTITQIGVVFGLGLLANSVINPGALTATNPWKFAYLVPVAVLLLSLAHRPQLRTRQLVFVVLLAMSCALNDARSYFATFLLVAALVVWQMRPTTMNRQRAWGWTAGMFAALAVGVYYLGQSLLLEGFLGEAAQTRSAEQLRTSGSLILGGRPELAATNALVRDQPFGFGVGAVPSLDDINVAKQGMFDTLSYVPDAGYVENFMFGGRLELHSTLGDFWAHFGIGGVLFCLVIAFHLVRGAAYRIGRGEASALLLFLTWWSLWNLIFSPAYSALPTLTLALGLTLLPRQERGASPPTPSGATPLSARSPE